MEVLEVNEEFNLKEKEKTNLISSQNYESLRQQIAKVFADYRLDMFGIIFT